MKISLRLGGVRGGPTRAYLFFVFGGSVKVEINSQLFSALDAGTAQNQVLVKFTLTPPPETKIWLRPESPNPSQREGISDHLFGCVLKWIAISWTYQKIDRIRENCLSLTCILCLSLYGYAALPMTSLN